ISRLIVVGKRRWRLSGLFRRHLGVSGIVGSLARLLSRLIGRRSFSGVGRPAGRHVSRGGVGTLIGLTLIRGRLVLCDRNGCKDRGSGGNKATAAEREAKRGRNGNCHRNGKSRNSVHLTLQ